MQRSESDGGEIRQVITGFLNLDKERGMTSSRAIGKLKGILRASGVDYGKIGHFGTLDPDGEGVLPIALGRATRLFDLLSEKTKVYDTVFRFGETTDTLDAGGTLLYSGDRIPTEAEILAVIPTLVGDIDQIPPAYSAKSVGGVRAYRLAREGVEVELRPRRVHIDRIEYEGRASEREFRFRVICGGGTYIRSIARDMAEALGTIGLMASIRRLQSGAFTIENSHKLAEFSADPLSFLIPVEAVLVDYPVLEIPKTGAGMRFYNGIPLQTDLSTGLYRLYDEGRLVGMGCVKGGAVHWTVRLI